MAKKKKTLLAEFREFAVKGNALELAIGVIIGAAFSNIVNSLVKDIVSPILGLFGNTDLSALVLAVGEVEIRYGAFLTALINFFIMAVVIFFLVKGLKALVGSRNKK